jgi:spore coat polysaccharide biosynthesis predicted glycosyltransferase SpsG
MEKTQLALSSNGRTVYELADMNIPSIVISHHDREATHSFASLEKGFINLGIINESTNKNIKEKFEKLVYDKDYRELLFMNIKKYNFRENKQKVVKTILELL